MIMSDQIEDRYISTLMLHALGDTIGFKNGEWEFYTDEFTFFISFEKLCEFIDLGGINKINLNGWRVSDDTLLHMAISRALISPYNSYDQLLDTTVKNFLQAKNQMRDDYEKKISRYIGRSTLKYLTKIQDGENWKDFKHDPHSVGNGSAMRCHCIGLAYHGEENRDKLINYAIDSSMMTHPNPVGWLGGLSVALFTAFAIEGVHLYLWPHKMLEIIESDKITKRINHQQSYTDFINAWKSYLESRFVEGKPVKTKSTGNVIQRCVYYNTLFGGKSGTLTLLGFNGHDGVIIAYDCLVDSKNNWEKLVIYSMLNALDSDTIGAIAGGLYGALYGMKGVPKNNLKYLEFSEQLHKMGSDLYKKFYLNEKI